MSLLSVSRDASLKLKYGLIPAVAVAAAAAVWPTERAAAAGPFQPFVGEWTGGGRVTGANGDREPIRCRAKFAESQRGEALSQTIVCASASYRVDIQSYVEASGRTVQGTWSEQTRGVSGHLTGRIEGGLLEGAVYGPNFTAGVSLKSNGKQQAVNIEPSGGDIAAVTIELARRGQVSAGSPWPSPSMRQNP
jgi:hypothetical protein